MKKLYIVKSIIEKSQVDITWICISRQVLCQAKIVPLIVKSGSSKDIICTLLGLLLTVKRLENSDFSYKLMRNMGQKYLLL